MVKTGVGLIAVKRKWDMKFDSYPILLSLIRFNQRSWLKRARTSCTGSSGYSHAAKCCLCSVSHSRQAWDVLSGPAACLKLFFNFSVGMRGLCSLRNGELHYFRLTGKCFMIGIDQCDFYFVRTRRQPCHVNRVNVTRVGPPPWKIVHLYVQMSKPGRYI